MDETLERLFRALDPEDKTAGDSLVHEMIRRGLLSDSGERVVYAILGADTKLWYHQGLVPTPQGTRTFQAWSQYPTLTFVNMIDAEAEARKLQERVIIVTLKWASIGYREMGGAKYG